MPQQRSRAGANVESGQHDQKLACQCIIELSQLSALALQCGGSEQFLQLESPSVQLAKDRYIEVAAVMKRSRAKSRDDIMALMHVTYIGEDALPPQQDTEM